MRKISVHYSLRSLCDMAVVAAPMFAIGIAGNRPWARWLAIGILVIVFIGLGVSLYHLFKDRPLHETPISKDISMVATYVWPCILSGLIVDHFGNDGLPFYILAGFVMGVIIFVNHNELM
ncbi:MAG: hypothetical protein K2I08_03980 [Muribaculaceae bacterium]|nr:hypothetical protein [Muribaculaceae bacterium]